MKAVFQVEVPKGHRLDELTIDYKLYADGKQIELGQNYPVWIPPMLDAEDYEFQFPGTNALEESKGWNRLVKAITGE